MLYSNDDMDNKPYQKPQQRPAAVNSIASLITACYYFYFIIASLEYSCSVMTMAPTFPSQRCEKAQMWYRRYQTVQKDCWASTTALWKMAAVHVSTKTPSNTCRISPFSVSVVSDKGCDDHTLAHRTPRLFPTKTAWLPAGIFTDACRAEMREEDRKYDKTPQEKDERRTRSFKSKGKKQLWLMQTLHRDVEGPGRPPQGSLGTT